MTIGTGERRMNEIADLRLSGQASIGPIEVDAQSNGSWDVVLNGRAVHINAARQWNEDNWGLGFEHEFPSSSPWIKVALANGFKDSMGHPSYMAGGGLKRRFRVGSDDFYVDLGGVAFLMTREDFNGNAPFPGILPAATLGFKRVAVNLTYMPETVVDRVTNSRRHDPSMRRCVCRLRPSSNRVKRCLP